MKNLMKKSILAVLALVILVTCIPTTAQASEQFKWVKSATLKGKEYKSIPGYVSGYDYCIWSDRDGTLTVKTGNGAVRAHQRESSRESWHTFDHSNTTLSDKSYSIMRNGFGSDLGVEQKYLKKNKTYTVPLRRGYNCISIQPCTDAKVKVGQTYKCKISTKDANIVVLSCKKDSNSKYALRTFMPEKQWRAFEKWVGPQDRSLCTWEGSKKGYCKDVAWYMRESGYADKDSTELYLEIQKTVEETVENGKKTGELISYKEAMRQYLRSLDGFKEAIASMPLDKYYEYSEIYSEEIKEIIDFIN